MTIKNIISEIENVDNPVTVLLSEGTNSKLIAIGLGKGILLKKHKAPGLTKLIVLRGKIEYQTEDSCRTFSELDEFQIPLEVVHSVLAKENSVFLLSVNN